VHGSRSTRIFWSEGPSRGPQRPQRPGAVLQLLHTVCVIKDCYSCISVRSVLETYITGFFFLRQVGKIAAGNGGVHKPVPLAEATNKRQPASQGQPAAPPPTTANTQPGAKTAAVLVTIDLSSDSPVPGTALKNVQVAEHLAQPDLLLQQGPPKLSLSSDAFTPLSHAAGPQVPHYCKDVDVSPNPVAAVRVADTAGVQHQQPMTPATAVVSTTSGTPVAGPDPMTTSTAKVLLPDAFLTTDQRRQLLDDCMQVGT